MTPGQGFVGLGLHRAEVLHPIMVGHYPLKADKHRPVWPPILRKKLRLNLMHLFIQAKILQLLRREAPRFGSKARVITVASVYMLSSLAIYRAALRYISSSIYASHMYPIYIQRLMPVHP